MEDNKTKKKERDLQFKEVCKVWGLAEAEVVRSLLISHGINSIFRGRVVQSVHAFSADGLGEIKILVSERDYEAAKQIIEERSPIEKADED